jgi:hypothetical protein
MKLAPLLARQGYQRREEYTDQRSRLQIPLTLTIFRFQARK